MEEIFFSRGVKEIISIDSLKKRLKERPLRIKYGVDPTRPDIHLGHAVGLWKLKELQDAGHTIIFLIGDYTTKIGDPSGRNVTRPILSDEEIKANAKTYFDQVGLILDVEKTEIRFNSEWFHKMSFSDLLQLAGKFTVAQIIEREDFDKRLKAGSDIGFHELLYPLMQAYDSIALKADVEFGGSDQKFNLLAGRDLQRKMCEQPQEIFMVELLVGLDGKTKMSKSSDNYISISEDARSMYGKVMSIPDPIIIDYYRLCTEISEVEIMKKQKQLESGENPKNVKMNLAFEIAKRYHGDKEAKKAEEEFIKVFSEKELPSDIPQVSLEYGNYELPLLLTNLQAVTSNSEARRLIEQGGIKLDGLRLTDPKQVISIRRGSLIQVGRRKFYRIK